MAAASVHCCLNASPPNPAPPPSSLPKPTLSPWPRKEAASWRGRCVSTAACVILGSAVGLAEVGGAGDSFAYAAADQTPAAAVVAPSLARWSQVRECPPWHANSLENIVPENLPRPSPRRRSETVRMSRSAPAIAGSPVGVAREGCYSL
ncbi:hypothetical protein Taro_033555 [Colocasia esculenta]|uniref:Uncharacterized protein n=1 Tax=Colocasia esculenta TaxID=4460 RepID=A0A843VU43_COLES|nr:hypothetical protein [Colocasia esculenta]